MPQTRIVSFLLLLLCLTAWSGVVQAAQHRPETSSESTVPRQSASAKAERPAQKKNTVQDKRAAHGNPRHIGAAIGSGSSWYLDGAPSRARGAVWEQGIPMESLLRKRNPGATPSQGSEQAQQGAGKAVNDARGLTSPSAVVSGKSAIAGVDTKKGIDSALGEISAYERQPADGSAMGLNKPGMPRVQLTKEESSWRNPVTHAPEVGKDVMSTRRNVVGAYADVVKSDDLHVTFGPELHIPESDTSMKHLTPQQSDSSALGVGMKWQWDF